MITSRAAYQMAHYYREQALISVANDSVNGAKYWATWAAHYARLGQHQDDEDTLRKECWRDDTPDSLSEAIERTLDEVAVLRPRVELAEENNAKLRDLLRQAGRAIFSYGEHAHGILWEEIEAAVGGCRDDEADVR